MQRVLTYQFFVQFAKMKYLLFELKPLLLNQAGNLIHGTEKKRDTTKEVLLEKDGQNEIQKL